MLLQEQLLARLPRLEGLQRRSRLTKNHEMPPPKAQNRLHQKNVKRMLNSNTPFTKGLKYTNNVSMQFDFDEEEKIAT